MPLLALMRILERQRERERARACVRVDRQTDSALVCSLCKSNVYRLLRILPAENRRMASLMGVIRG